MIDPTLAALANSVPVRVQYALTYKPGNLIFDGDRLPDRYSYVKVVNDVTL